jgi:acyl-CoA reductase-like NAD-dependent aldehyde dehydrogenase
LESRLVSRYLVQASVYVSQKKVPSHLLTISHCDNQHSKVEMDEFTSFVNTVNGTSVTGKVTQGTDPSTRQNLWDVPVASSEDIENAVSSAKTAFTQWSKTSWSDRQNALLDARDVLIYHKPALARLITKEGGKPVSGTFHETIPAVLTIADSICHS